MGRYTYTELSEMLYRYGKQPDKALRRELHKLRPDWFDTVGSAADRALIKMAKEGKPKPTKGKPYYNRLSNIRRNNPKYRFGQTLEILQRIRPDWFIPSNVVSKSELLRMAKQGESRPHSVNTSIGRKLVKYTAPQSNGFDPKFTKEIQAVRPDWFRKCKLTSKQFLQLSIAIIEKVKNDPKCTPILSQIEKKIAQVKNNNT